MLVIPAIDLREGKCVRLYQGRRDEETVFSTDPVAVAKMWQDKGASWLHVVDLDGAFTGRPANLEAVKSILAGVDIPVQLGGGLRTLEAVEQAFDLGVSRVVIGTAAVQDAGMLAEVVERFDRSRVAVGVDSKNGWVAVEGWETVVEKKVLDLIAEIKEFGVERIIYTDIWRDGTMEGVNLEGTREVAQYSQIRIIASGGVSSLDDLRALKELEAVGVEGVILGRALYVGAFSLEEALQVAGG